MITIESFDSILVRLKGHPQVKKHFNVIVFRFHTGSIKRDGYHGWWQ